MKEIVNTTCGGFELEDGKLVRVFGGATDNGECYKDNYAWVSPVGWRNIIYIGEYGLIDLERGWEIEDVGWTKEKLLEWIKSDLADIDEKYGADMGFVERIACHVYNACDWQDLSTYWNEWLDDVALEEDMEYEWAKYKAGE